MTYSIALSNAASFALQAAPQSNFLTASISKVAFSALSCLAASFHVVPAIVPAIFCMIVGVSVALSLFHAIQEPYTLQPSYIPIAPPRVSYWNYDPFPYYNPIRVRTAPIFPIYSAPRTSFIPRRDIVGERSSFACPRPVFTAPRHCPAPSFKRDRVGERAPF